MPPTGFEPVHLPPEGSALSPELRGQFQKQGYPEIITTMNVNRIEVAYFATGCFWGAERRFWQTQGVINTSVGYQGGNLDNPSYELVCTGKTNHTETVKVEFDPHVISFHELLALFFEMHDPTSLNRQGNDVGTQYRSAIFTTSSEQEVLAKNAIRIYQAELSKAGIGKIVTEISSASNNKYWPAEEYHQRYLEKNPKGYDCHSNTGIRFPLLDDAKLKLELDPLSYEVLRHAATEQAFSGEYTDTEIDGIYNCKACGAKLFESKSKFHSGCGWPSFYTPIETDAVLLIEDRSLAPRIRTEVRCANCNSHLGHVFEGEGFDTPTDERWCINSVSLTLKPN
ncbi:MAG: hypothetical protein RL448_36 [Actinomycetota bacterium]